MWGKERAAVRFADRPPNKLHDAVTLVEVKGLAIVAETVAHRAGRIDSDIDKAALALDTNYPGSTILAEKNKYGEGGKYLALVTGSLGNGSADLSIVVDLIAGIKTVRALELRITNQARPSVQHASPSPGVLFRPVHNAPMGPPHPWPLP